MKISILVTGDAYSNQSVFTAYQFCTVALQQGHDIAQVFFYQDAASVGNRLSVTLGDEFNGYEAWSKLAQEYSIPLKVCVSSAERRGVLNHQQSTEFDKQSFNLGDAFEISGLGELHDSSVECDRLVTFK